MKSKKIVLLGYMSSGKTAVGSLLKKTLNLPFWDLDHYLEHKFDSAVTTIFEEKGELYFRKQERIALEELLASEESMIISLGGGTPCYYDTMHFLKSQIHVHTFYLQTAVDVLSDRLQAAKLQRPLIAHLKNIEEIQTFVGKHLFERNTFYNQADFKIITNKKSIEAIATELKDLLTEVDSGGFSV